MTFAFPTTPELLAPAGDWEALHAAVANGADAVYFGLPLFNARHRAANFTLEELPAVVEYLHRHNVRGYVTFNTLIFSDELPEAVQFLECIADAGVDAVIVQDLGLAHLVRLLVPTLAVHASTQMTLTEPRGLEFVRQLGVERAILARELSVEEIRRIAVGTDMSLEVFVHGALCVAYSGQCLTSEALGGRSANRGQCAQACRLPYEMFVDGQPHPLGDRAYLLSPQDLAAYDLIDDLVQSGVICFKIEGRLKSPAYVASSTQTYRAALDAALKGTDFTLAQEGRLDLEQGFSRGFTPGFLRGVNHQELVQGRFPKSRGVRVGTVVSRNKRGVMVQLTEQAGVESLIKPGDGVVFDSGHPEQEEPGGRVFEVRVPGEQRGKSTRPGQRVELLFGRGGPDLRQVNPGDRVWKTDDPAFRKRMEASYARPHVVHRIALDVTLRGQVGAALELSVRTATGHHTTLSWPGPLQSARKHPLSEEGAREHLGRLGDTPFVLRTVQLEADEPLHVPHSVLNDLRRQAVAQLLQHRRAHHSLAEPGVLKRLRAEIRQSHPVAEPPSYPTKEAGELRVLVRTWEQLEAVLAWQPPGSLSRPAVVYCDFEDVRRYHDAVTRARAAGLPIGLATLRIIKPGEEGLLKPLARLGADALLIRNLAGLMLFREQPSCPPLVGDFSLNVANELTAALLAREGFTRLVPSHDLNWEQLTALLQRIDPGLFEIVVHHHMPMFHMEHCVYAAFLSQGKDWRDCGRPCDHHRVDLRDRVGAEFPVIVDTGCRNTVFNSVAQSAAEFIPRMQALGVRHFRVELLRERGEQVGPLLEQYTRVLAGLDDGRGTWRRLQVVNQLGLTRGTLQLV